MALCTLAYVKAHLGIASTDASQDAALLQWLAAAIDLARHECKKWLGGFISANTVANPTVCTSVNHGLITGDVVTLANSNSTPVLDGQRTVTRIDRDTFSVPVNVTVAGSAGDYAKQVTEYLGGDNTNVLVLSERPVQSIASINVDGSGTYGQASGAFDSTTLLVSGTDYALKTETNLNGQALSLSGIVYRIGSYWPAARSRTLGMLALDNQRGIGNVKAVYSVGYSPVPEDLKFAVATLVALMRLTASKGMPLQSETITYYSYALSSVADAVAWISSVNKTLGRYKRIAIF